MARALTPNRRACVVLAFAPAAVLLAACPPVPIVDVLNASGRTISVSVTYPGSYREQVTKTVPVGRSRKFQYHPLDLYVPFTPIRIRADRCEYTYDPKRWPRSDGISYDVRVEPDFSLSILTPRTVARLPDVAAKARAFGRPDGRLRPDDIVCGGATSSSGG